MSGEKCLYEMRKHCAFSGGGVLHTAHQTQRSNAVHEGMGRHHLPWNSNVSPLLLLIQGDPYYYALALVWN